MLVSNPNLEFLLSDNILSWPLRVIFLCDFTLLDDPLELFDQQWTDPHLFPDQRVVSVVGIVGISQTALRVLKLEKLVTVHTLMTSVVPQIERVLLCSSHDG